MPATNEITINTIMNDPSPTYARIRTGIAGLVGYKLFGGLLGAVAAAAAWAYYKGEKVA